MAIITIGSRSVLALSVNDDRIENMILKFKSFSMNCDEDLYPRIKIYIQNKCINVHEYNQKHNNIWRECVIDMQHISLRENTYLDVVIHIDYPQIQGGKDVNGEDRMRGIKLTDFIISKNIK